MKRLKLLDYILIAAVIALVITFAIRKTGSNYKNYKAEGAEHKKITLNYKLENLRSFSVDSVSVGDKIFDEDSQKLIGIVEKVEVTETEDYIFDNAGKAHKTTIPGYYTLYIDVKAKVREDETRLLTESGLELNLNSNHKIITQTTFFNPVLLSLNFDEDHEK